MKSIFFVVVVVSSFLVADISFSFDHANDIDTSYKFDAVVAPETPYKNTWSAFQTDLFSGSFSYQFNIDVPPGTNGLAPNLSIAYNSHSAKGKAGWLGAGFDMPLTYIQRDIEYTRKDANDDTFDLFLEGAKHDLVHVPSENRYHTKIESYLKVEKKTGAPNQTGTYWVVHAKDGTQYRFGYNEDAEHMMQTSDPSMRVPPPQPERLPVYRFYKPSNGDHFFTISEAEKEIVLNTDDWMLEGIGWYAFNFQKAGTWPAYRLLRNTNGTHFFTILLEEKNTVFAVEPTKWVDEGIGWYAYPSPQAGTVPVHRFRKVGDGFHFYTAYQDEVNMLRADTEHWQYEGIAWHAFLSQDTVPNAEQPVLPQYVWRWSLDRIKDANGNCIYFKYTENPTSANVPQSGAVYLRRIEYNNDRKRAVDFILEDRPDVYLSMDQGSEIIQTKRLKEIKTSVNGSPARSYRFSYTLNEALNQSLLTAITPYGAKGGALPPVTFEYISMTPGFTEKPGGWQTPAGTQWIRRTNHKSDTIVDTFDINGDQLPDLVKAKDSGKWEAFLNNGNGFNTFASIWDPPSGWFEIRDIRRSQDLDEGANTRMAPMDVNRDGLQDVVRVNSSNVMEYKLNIGTEFENTSSIPLPFDNAWIRRVEPPEDDDPDKKNAPNVKQKFLDINGDGLEDIVKRAKNHFGDNRHAWHIYRNTGSGFVDYGYWPVENQWIEDFERDDNDVELTNRDMNADGLVDIIWGKDNGNWRVFLNTGSQFLDSAHWFRYPVAQQGNWYPWGLSGNTEDDIIDVEKSNNPDKPDNTKRVLSDLNGDGLPDVVHARDDNGRKWDVWLNKGYGFGSKIEWPFPYADEYVIDMTFDGETDPSEQHARARRDLLDINGDGHVDVVSVAGQGLWNVFFNNTARAGLLKKVTDTLGGVLHVAYNPSTLYPNAQFPQKRLNSNYWLVSSITTDNGMTGPHRNVSTTRYSYADGYYHYGLREFRGFAKVEEIRADESRVHHFFLQDETNKGKEYKTLVTDKNGVYYSMTKHHWQDATAEVWGTPSSAIRVPRLVQADDFTYDGVQDNPKIKRSEYKAFDAYGNIGLEIERGDVATAGDETFTHKEFHHMPARWIVDRVARRYVTATENGDPLRETWFEYDADGNLIQETAYLNTGPNPVTIYEYDSYGNVVAATDPEGRTTETTYDSQFHAFPVIICNALNQCTQREYNPFNGEIITETDPNGFVAAYRYDQFGRRIKEILPYDSPELPTVQIQYFLDGSAPEAVLTSRREISGQAGTLDKWQYIDGFSNLIQTKTDSETPAGEKAQVATNVFYDEMGRVRHQSNPYQTGYVAAYAAPDTGVPGTTYGYDAVGRPVLVVNPDNTRILRSFDHWAVTETDENGHVAAYVFDAFQKLIRVVENNQGKQYRTWYRYNALGEIVELKDHFGNTATLVYDTLGRKLRLDDPDMGVWTYEYDRVGNLVQQTDARNVSIAMGYDALDRKKTINYPSDDEVLFFYDKETDAQNGVIGTLAEVRDAAGTARYGYDQRLRKIREERSIDGMVLTSEWTYDASDRTTSHTYPNGEVVQFRYNEQGMLKRIPGIVTDLTYNPNGQMTRKTYANGVATSYSYHPKSLRLTRIDTPGLQGYAYAYDNVGNITSIEDGVAGLTERFGYDDLDRLVSAGDSEYNRTFSYDAIGNMLTETRGDQQVVYHYNALGPRPHAVVGMTITEESGMPVSGPIDADTVWAADHSPYTLENDIEIAPGATLVIREGVVVNGGNFDIEVLGNLFVQGTKAARVELNAVHIVPDMIPSPLFLRRTASQQNHIIIHHAKINSGSIYYPTGNAVSERFELKDSTLHCLSNFHIAYPNGNCDIERNVFVNCSGISIGASNGVAVYVRNNAFYNQTTDYAIESLDVFESAELIVRFNSFMNTEEIALSLRPGHTAAGMAASENFWNTQEESVIDGMIFDLNDEPETSGYIEYQPILATPDPNTPVLASAPGNIDLLDCVDLKDAVLAMRIIAGTRPQSIYSEADVNGDGRVGLEEAVFVLQVIANSQR